MSWLCKNKNCKLCAYLLEKSKGVVDFDHNKEIISLEKELNENDKNSGCWSRPAVYHTPLPRYQPSLYEKDLDF